MIPELNKDSKTPLYVQIYEQLSYNINNGIIKCGAKLPSQRRLADDLGVSVNTIINAYDMLARYDYVAAEDRSGYYVKEREIPEKPGPEKRWHSDAPSIYNFSKNGVDLKMSDEFRKSFRRVVKTITDGDFSYPDYTGEYELRKQICSMLNKSWGIVCAPTQIVVGASLIYLIDSLIKVIGSDLVYGFENPAYYKLSNYVRLGEYKTTYMNVFADGLNSDTLKDLDADALFLMPYHHYPLSYAMTDEQKNAVLSWAGEDRYIIEYGLNMEYLYTRPVKPLYSATENKNVIFISDFTRTVSPNCNVAYLVLPESLVKRWQEVYLSYHSAASKLEQYFIIEILRNGSYYRNVARLRKLYNQKREHLISAIRSHPLSDRIKILNSESGACLLIEPQTDCDSDVLIDECHKAGVKLSYIKNALEQPNGLISPRTYILGFGELSESEIKNGAKLLLDTWGNLM